MDGSDVRDRPGDVPAALLERCRAGDRTALIELLSPFDHEVLNMAYRLLGQSSDAHDIRQQAYLRVCRSIGGFDGRSAFRTWLLRIVVNLCRDHLRRCEARRRRVDGWRAQHARPVVDEPMSRCATNEQSQRVAEAVAELPGPQREVLVLRHFHELTLAQVARILDIPVSTASSHLSTAMRRLAARLSETDEEHEPCGYMGQEQDNAL